MPWTIEGIDLANESQSESRLLELISNVQSFVVWFQPRVRASPYAGPSDCRPSSGLVSRSSTTRDWRRPVRELPSVDRVDNNWNSGDDGKSSQVVLSTALIVRLARADLVDDWLWVYRRMPDSPAEVVASLRACGASLGLGCCSNATTSRLAYHPGSAVPTRLNSGALPETLDRLTPLPAWPDTSTGKPFEYHRTDLHHAVIQIAKSPGVPSEYQIEIRQ